MPLPSGIYCLKVFPSRCLLQAVIIQGFRLQTPSTIIHLYDGPEAGDITSQWEFVWAESSQSNNNTTVINVRKRICILVHWFGWLKNACLLTGLAGVDNVKGCVANLWIACFCESGEWGENVWVTQARVNIHPNTHGGGGGIINFLGEIQ